MQVGELLNAGIRRLRKGGVPDAEIDAALLLGRLLDLGRTQLLLADFAVSQEVFDRYEELLCRRLEREPLAYIIGVQEFWSLPFVVSPDVLIPRPETEFLLETILQTLAEQGAVKGPLLDLCTGSGVIAVILALELCNSMVYGVDRSIAALKIACQNSAQHKVQDRVRFFCADLFSALHPRPWFSLVVSNPPYVAQEILAGLQPEVRDYEPRLALDGGSKGLETINSIASGLDKVLLPGGWFFMEIGADQGDYVLELFKSLQKYDSVYVYKDYAGLPRVLQARLVSAHRHRIFARSLLPT